MNKYTPGPWRHVDEHRPYVPTFQVRATTDLGEQIIAGDVCGEANACLVAAAPDLLEIARMVAGDGVYGTKDYPLSQMVKAARAAITKATGGAK